MTADELDRAYVALSQTLSRVPPEEHATFLARLALLLLAGHPDCAVALEAIASAEADAGS